MWLFTRLKFLLLAVLLASPMAMAQRYCRGLIHGRRGNGFLWRKAGKNYMVRPAHVLPVDTVLENTNTRFGVDNRPFRNANAVGYRNRDVSMSSLSDAPRSRPSKIYDVKTLYLWNQCTSPPVGTKVEVWTSNWRLRLAYTCGPVTGTITESRSSYFRINVPNFNFVGGHSGSPVVLRGGPDRVLGMVTTAGRGTITIPLISHRGSCTCGQAVSLENIRINRKC